MRDFYHLIFFDEDPPREQVKSEFTNIVKQVCFVVKNKDKAMSEGLFFNLYDIYMNDFLSSLTRFLDNGQIKSIAEIDIKAAGDIFRIESSHAFLSMLFVLKIGFTIDQLIEIKSKYSMETFLSKDSIHKMLFKGCNIEAIVYDPSGIIEVVMTPPPVKPIVGVRSFQDLSGMSRTDSSQSLDDGFVVIKQTPSPTPAFER